MATFFCFLRTVGDLYCSEVEQNDEQKLPDIPSSMFFDTSISYYDMERVGGIVSYLYKTHHKEVCQALSIPDYMPNNAAAPTPAPGHHGGAVNPFSVHRDTPMPSVLQLNTSDPDGTASDGSTSDGNSHSPSPLNQIMSERTITITVPRIQPVLPIQLGENTGILSTAIGNVTTNAAQQEPPEIAIAPPPPPPLPRQAPDHNNDVHVSTTSSGEDVSAPMPVPHLGAALIAGTPRLVM